jgi:DNA polymerase Ligase (LigD)
MPRFVILEHDHPHLHWDFMLEAGDVLRTWRLSAPPAGGSSPISATASGDHRPFYLDYEGPVSGGRGQVRRWDAGEYEEEVSDAERLQVRLRGQRVSGTVVLERASQDEWCLLYRPE